MPKRKRCSLSERQCLVCGKTEPRKPAGKTAFLCSRECWLKRRNQLWAEQHPTDESTLDCQLCGKPFVPKPNIRWKAKYCSRRCNQKSHRARAYIRRHDFFAQKNRRWRENNKWDGNWYKALTRDNFICQLCGKVGSENSLKERLILVHHLDGEGETGGNNHVLDNLMTLCYDCHEGMHGVSMAYLDGKWQFAGKILQRFRFEPPVIEQFHS